MNLWYRASNEKVVVMARKAGYDHRNHHLVFLYLLFLSFPGFHCAIVSLASESESMTGRGLRKLFQLNIRSQVHSTIIFISVFSFIIIGIATISFFNSRYNRNNSDKLSRTMKIMVNEMQKKLTDHSTFDDVITDL